MKKGSVGKPVIGKTMNVVDDYSSLMFPGGKRVSKIEKIPRIEKNLWDQGKVPRHTSINRVDGVRIKRIYDTNWV